MEYIFFFKYIFMWLIESMICPKFFKVSKEEAMIQCHSGNKNFKGLYFLTDGNASALEKQLMLKPQKWLESTNRHNLLCSPNDFDLQE